MYLAADYLRKQGLDKKSKISFFTPGSVIFGVKSIADTLLKVINRYHINLNLSHTLVKIDADQKIAYFKNTSVNQTGELLAVSFDFLHLAPPQTAPQFVKESMLVNDAGWLDVHVNSLQHHKYSNIFGIGDVAALPTAKTGAAIRKQAPVVVDNILKLISGHKADNLAYQGYSSCPLVTGY